MKENTMTLRQALKILEEASAELQLESYHDYAYMCEFLSQIAEARVVRSLALNDPNDDEITIENLQKLKSALHESKQLFIVCDKYYRAYMHKT